MYYTAGRMGSFGATQAQQPSMLQNVFDMLKGAPQTQKDIRTIAQTAQTAQQQDVVSSLQAYAGTQLFLQIISTTAMVGMFLIALKKYRGN